MKALRWALGSILLVACSGGARSFDVVDGGSDGGVEASLAVDSGPTVFADFPPPIVEPNVPAGAPALFADATAASSGGPCLLEPEALAAFPKNWLRPRFTWSPVTNASVYELRVHVANQTRDLLVYTAQTAWTMPAELWALATEHSADVDVQVTVRSANVDGATITKLAFGSSIPIRIAPVEAPGSIVYWSTTSKSLKGFKVGDEAVVDVLKPAQFGERKVDCVGCHSSSPDGEFVGFSTKLEGPFEPATEYAGGVSPLEKNSAGTTPSFVGAGAKQALAQPYRGMLAFSGAHWKQGDRRVVTQYATTNNASSGALQWLDLEAASVGAASGTLARTGDPGVPVAPTWSHDGTTVAYVSAKTLVDSRADQPPIDVYTVPYANGAGGVATKLAGASDPAYDEHYPAFSPDDALLAFVRTPTNASVPAVFDPAKEVFVLPAKGGTPTRLAANDPPACGGVKSPGAYNSFPKWAPGVTKAFGVSWYWLVFSSKRFVGPDAMKHTQLYLVAVAVDASGTVRPAGAVRLWNLPEGEDNHTPAWDRFKTPDPN